MDKTRWERLGAASGIGAAVLVIAAFAAVPAPPKLSDLAKTVSYTSHHRTGLLIQSYLIVLASMAFVWFAGSVRTHMRRNEGEPGRLADVGFGAALVGVALFCFSALMLALQGFRADGIINDGNLQLTVDLSTLAVMMAFAPMGVWVGATALASYRSDAFPRVHSLLGAVAACGFLATPLLMLGHTGFFSVDQPFSGLIAAMTAFVIWTLSTSILLIVGEAAEVAAETDATIITHEHWHLRRASGQ